MKPAKPAPAFIDEAGVRITMTHLSTPNFRIELRQLGYVTIAIDPEYQTVMGRLLKKGPANLRLMVCTKSDHRMKCAFETEDGELMQRIREAMDKGRQTGRSSS